MSDRRHVLAEEPDDRPERRIRIIHHATQAFLSEGFEGANLADIALAAGVGKVTIYRYFTDKADLFGQVMMFAAQHVAGPLRALLPVDAPIEETLIRYAERYMNLVIAPICGSHPFYETARLIYSTSLTQRAIAASYQDIFHRELTVPRIRYFSAMIEKGEIAEESAEFLAHYFGRLMFSDDHAIMAPAKLPRQAEIEDLARRAVKIFLRGAR